MNNKINFDFVSPEASIVSSEVDMVLIPGIDGDAGILPDHAPFMTCLLYTSPSPRDATLSRMPSSA